MPAFAAGAGAVLAGEGMGDCKTGLFIFCLTTLFFAAAAC